MGYSADEILEGLLWIVGFFLIVAIFSRSESFRLFKKPDRLSKTDYSMIVCSIIAVVLLVMMLVASSSLACIFFPYMAFSLSWPISGIAFAGSYFDMYSLKMINSEMPTIRIKNYLAYVIFWFGCIFIAYIILEMRPLGVGSFYGSFFSFALAAFFILWSLIIIIIATGRIYLGRNKNSRSQ